LCLIPKTPIKYKIYGIDISHVINASSNLIYLQIVDKILSFTHSASDLLSFRYINRSFHNEATKRLRILLSNDPINLYEETSVLKFLDLLPNRIDVEGEDETNSFPFSAFKMDITIWPDILERFAAEAGQFVRRLDLLPLPYGYAYDPRDQLDQRVVLLLSRTPNLVEINFVTCSPLYVRNNDSDRVTLPSSFPELRVIGLDHWVSEPYSPPRGAIPLLSLLISRAPQLNEVKFLRIQHDTLDTHGMTAVRALTQHHPQEMPLVRNARIKVRPGTLPAVNELMTVNLRIVHLTANLLLFNKNSAVNTSVIESFTPWLASQSTNLRTLCLTSLIATDGSTNLSFPIPTLEKLKVLHLNFENFNNNGNGPISTVVSTLTPNQFPALRKLYLTLNQTTIVEFGSNPLPSVKEFHVNASTSTLELNPWHLILPNLTGIYFYNEGSVTSFDRRNLRYILRRFPRITHLDLDFRPCSNDNSDYYWDILTAGAPRPASTAVLLRGELEVVEGDGQEPALGNLRGKSSIFYVDTRRVY